jgi:carboxymethylenebutenolidase
MRRSMMIALRCAQVSFLLGLAAAGVAAAAEDPVRQRLDASPRHHEWVEVKNGERTIHCFVAFPQTKEKSAVVLVIHENKGLTDWVRGVADQVAEAGYIAVAPDLLSGLGPNGGRTSDFPSVDAATQAIYALKPEQVISDLDAVAEHALKLPSADGRLAVAGFCWGGAQSFRFATKRADLKAAFVFYGSSPSADEMARIACPIYGFYGGDDARITAAVPDTAAKMKDAGKRFEPVTYDGAGHGFMRSGEDPQGSEPNRKARDAAWQRWKALLKSL